MATDKNIEAAVRKELFDAQAMGLISRTAENHLVRHIVERLSASEQVSNSAGCSTIAATPAIRQPKCQECDGKGVDPWGETCIGCGGSGRDPDCCE